MGLGICIGILAPRSLLPCRTVCSLSLWYVNYEFLLLCGIKFFIPAILSSSIICSYPVALLYPAVWETSLIDIPTAVRHDEESCEIGNLSDSYHHEAVEAE